MKQLTMLLHKKITVKDVIRKHQYIQKGVLHHSVKLQCQKDGYALTVYINKPMIKTTGPIKVYSKERGWAGHFICSDRCGYHRNTLIECGDDKVVVSTVGNYRPKGMLDKPQIIGHNRLYETMAFEAKLDDAKEYWEADVSKQYNFKSDWSIGDLENAVDSRADKMHDNAVKEIAEGLIIKNNKLPNNI